MQEMLLHNSNTEEGIFINDLTFYFLERGKQVVGGWNAAYISIYHIQLLNRDISLLDDDQFTASSNHPDYVVHNVKYTNGNRWFHDSNNPGNTNRSCWLKIDNIKSRLVGARIFFAAAQSCRHVLIESNNQLVGEVNVKHLATNYYPNANSAIHPVGYGIVCEILFDDK